MVLAITGSTSPIIRSTYPSGPERRALALTCPSNRTIARAEALNAAAFVAFYRGDPAGEQWNEEALAISREREYASGIWFALQNLAALARLDPSRRLLGS